MNIRYIIASWELRVNAWAAINETLWSIDMVVRGVDHTRMNMNDDTHTPHTHTADDLAQIAWDHSNHETSPLAFHLEQWAEEVGDHTIADSLLMLETAKTIIEAEQRIALENADRRF